jgi:hypothetical protein
MRMQVCAVVLMVILVPHCHILVQALCEWCALIRRYCCVGSDASSPLSSILSIVVAWYFPVAELLSGVWAAHLLPGVSLCLYLRRLHRSTPPPCVTTGSGQPLRHALTCVGAQVTSAITTCHGYELHMLAFCVWLLCQILGDTCFLNVLVTGAYDGTHLMCCTQLARMASQGHELRLLGSAAGLLLLRSSHCDT